jgi:hypothetical protein
VVDTRQAVWSSDLASAAATTRKGSEGCSTETQRGCRQRASRRPTIGGSSGPYAVAVTLLPVCLPTLLATVGSSVEEAIGVAVLRVGKPLVSVGKGRV